MKTLLNRLDKLEVGANGTDQRLEEKEISYLLLLGRFNQLKENWPTREDVLATNFLHNGQYPWGKCLMTYHINLSERQRTNCKYTEEDYAFGRSIEKLRKNTGHEEPR